MDKVIFLLLLALVCIGIYFVLGLLNVSTAKKYLLPNVFRATEIYGIPRHIVPEINKRLFFRSLLQDSIKRRWSYYPCDTQLMENGIYVSRQIHPLHHFRLRLLIPWEAIETIDKVTFSSFYMFLCCMGTRKRDLFMLTVRKTPVVLHLPCDHVGVHEVLEKYQRTSEENQSTKQLSPDPE